MSQGVKVSIIGAGSTYGIFLVKWALQLKYFPQSQINGMPVPQLQSVSFSNTTARNKDLVMEVLLNDLSHMKQFDHEHSDKILKDVHGYSNWREMLLKEKPDMVVICSPMVTHVPYMREILTDFNVKAILCEPPLCPFGELGSLQNIVQLAKEKNVQIGANQQYMTLYDCLKELPLNTENPGSTKFGDVLTGIDGLDITFITHGSRMWRKMQGVGEREILEDLGPHVFHLIPESLRRQAITVKDVKKEGDNLFLNFVEYNLLLGKVPARITLGYHRKLKNMKLIFRKKKKDYEFHISGAVNPESGEFTRWIEGKNYAYPFKHFLKTDLVKASFISSLAGKSAVPIEEAIDSLKFVEILKDNR